MAGVFESYEQQFSTITGDITSRIAKIPNLTGTEKKTAIGVVDGILDEAGELLEQMDLELRDVPATSRPQLKQRLDKYRAELKRLRKEFKQSQVALGGASMRKELFGGSDDMSTSEDHRSKLLSNTDRIQRTSDRLDEGYRIAQETEEIGLGIMDNLQRDRETIQRMRGRLRDTDADLSRGSRIVRRIHRRIIQHKIFFVVGALVVLAIIIIVVVAIVVVKTKK